MELEELNDEPVYWAFKGWTSFVSPNTGKTWWKPVREAELYEKRLREHWARQSQIATEQKVA